VLEKPPCDKQRMLGSCGQRTSAQDQKRSRFCDRRDHRNLMFLAVVLVEQAATGEWQQGDDTLQGEM
jgi:hypothetical protein